MPGAVAIVIVLLLFVFGSLVSSGLPFLVAAIAALGSFFIIWLATQTADTSVFGINLVTGLSLGLGIDYALLIVNRFREERAGGKSVEDSVTTTLTTSAALMDHAFACNSGRYSTTPTDAGMNNSPRCCKMLLPTVSMCSGTWPRTLKKPSNNTKPNTGPGMNGSANFESSSPRAWKMKS